jgi:signal transduction histidine kinase
MDLLIRLSSRTGLVANLVLGLALTGILAIELALTPGSRSSTLPISLVIIALALFRERNRAWALTGGLAVCAVAATIAAVADLPPQPGFAGTAALLVLGASYLRVAAPRSAGLTAVAGLVVLTASRVGLRGSLILPTALLGVIGWGAALGIGVWLRSLDTHRRALLEATRRDERLELARELHDDVAHHIAAIVVQSQAARLLAARRPEHLAGALAEIEATGNDALIAMRRVIGLLRDADDPQTAAPGGAELRTRVARFGARGRPVELRLPDDQEAWTPEIRTTVYRVTQEALTNIVRHAPDARAVQILVNEDAAVLTIEVNDDGPRRSPAPPWTSGSGGWTPGAGGYGLVGMRERVEALGGHFEAGPEPAGGWTVRARIPRSGTGIPRSSTGIPRNGTGVPRNGATA